jgi:hypothetical protein
MPGEAAATGAADAARVPVHRGRRGLEKTDPRCDGEGKGEGEREGEREGEGDKESKGEGEVGVRVIVAVRGEREAGEWGAPVPSVKSGWGMERGLG